MNKMRNNQSGLEIKKGDIVGQINFFSSEMGDFEITTNSNPLISLK